MRWAFAPVACYLVYLSLVYVTVQWLVLSPLFFWGFYLAMTLLFYTVFRGRETFHVYPTVTEEARRRSLERFVMEVKSRRCSN